MRKSVVLLLIGLVLCSSNVLALQSPQYSQTLEFGGGKQVLSSGMLSMVFTGLSAHLLDATLAINVDAVTPGSFTINGSRNFALISTYDSTVAGDTFLVGSNLFSSANESLDLVALNGSMSQGVLGLNFQQLVGTTTIRSATLSGTLAPEPASMALVAAGLVGLPFVRRFRKSLH